MMYRLSQHGVRRAWGSPGSGLPRIRSVRKTALSLTTAAAIQIWYSEPADAENHLDYRYESYQEEADRMEVQTHAATFEQSLLSNLTLRGEYVHDAVSGATPTGAPPPAGRNQVPLAHMDDERNAGFLDAALRYGRNTTSAQFSYSLEHDYESIGVSLTQSLDFNQKNTTLSFGYAHNFDDVFPNFWGGKDKRKNSDDLFVGVTQLLSKNAYVTANATVGDSSGYLSDPYKGVRFDGYPDPNTIFPEKRPTYKTKEIGYVSLAWYFDPLNGSAEAAYRFYHDSYDIFSHTASLAWHQKVGKWLVLNPFFRYSRQTAASFYATRFPGDPSDPESPIPIPKNYSADYRLSQLETFAYGITATLMIKERVYLDAGYNRYEMYGLDHSTSSSAYPKANTWSAGLRFLW